MQHYVLRCKHCNSEHIWSPTGHRDDGGSRDYCPICQKAIDDALNRIPVKFIPKEKEINEPRLFKLFDTLRSAQLEKQENYPLSVAIPLNSGVCKDYDVAEIFIHNGKKFIVRWNNDTPNDKHISVFLEYDNIEGDFTGKIWKYDGEDFYAKKTRPTINLKEFVASNEVPIVPMTSPTANFFYLYPISNEETKKEEEKEREHIMTVRTSTDDGWGLKSAIKHGWYKTSVKLAEGINVNDIIDYIDYEYTYVKYDDEDFATIVKIECV